MPGGWLHTATTAIRIGCSAWLLPAKIVPGGHNIAKMLATAWHGTASAKLACAIECSTASPSLWLPHANTRLDTSCAAITKPTSWRPYTDNWLAAGAATLCLACNRAGHKRFATIISLSW
mmetsp:Transcript_103274/g.313347  ORF Transcript_103274/g.313347 Transcript_103274/m.313347 type:complete len:120 (+) Transcript_103274:1346-1705(+)